MEGYAVLAWRCARQTARVDSAENMAALMAPEDLRGVQLQRMEDAGLRRLLQLTNALAKV